MTECTQKVCATDARPLTTALAVTAAFMLVEAAGGILASSLALLSDAGHMFTDAGALALSLFALWLARRPADEKRTYGYYRIEILAALVNGVFLWVLVFFILKEAAGRFLHPAPVKVGWMMAVGAAGLLVNLLNLILLHRGRKENLNVRAAWLHVLGDTLGSVGVVGAGAVILLTGWIQADAVAGALIGILILYSSWGLIRESLHILLEGSPGHLPTGEIERALGEVPGVLGVHDLHVWTLTPQVVLLTAHVLAAEGESRCDTVRERIENLLRKRWGIIHATIQVERTACRESRLSGEEEGAGGPGHTYHGHRHRH